MIRELKITNPERTPIEWWASVEALKGRESIEFNPDGPTVIWGPNGVGKSSIIKALAMLTHCEQGGYPKVTDHSVRKFRRIGDDGVLDGMSIVSDGQPVNYMAPDLNPGLQYGMAAFDYDFMAEAMGGMGAMKTSSGQQVQRRLGLLMQQARKPGKVKRNGYVGDDEKSVVLGGLEASPGVSKGKPTLLLDEPLRSLDLFKQVELWMAFEGSLFTEFQVIIASHSMFSMDIKGASYIELAPRYRDRCAVMIDLYTSVHGTPWAWRGKAGDDEETDGRPKETDSRTDPEQAT